IGERIGALAVEAGDVAGDLRSYVERIDADPQRLVAVEERLEALDRLERKHGGPIESVLAPAARCRAESGRTEGPEGRDAGVTSGLTGPSGARWEATDGCDETDGTVRGNTARTDDEPLRDLGTGGQVIFITHLAQAVSPADGHFPCSKGVGQGESLATVKRMD